MHTALLYSCSMLFRLYSAQLLRSTYRTLHLPPSPISSRPPSLKTLEHMFPPVCTGPNLAPLDPHYFLHFPVISFTLFTHKNAAHGIVSACTKACAGLAGRGCVRYVSREPYGVEGDLLGACQAAARAPHD